MTVSVRFVREDDAPVWRELYRGYRDFYHLDHDAEALERTWQWVSGRQHDLFGLVACDAEDRPVALANLRWFARPSRGSIGLYLDDLFTSPEVRRSGAGEALLRRAAEIANENGADVVRWITANDNATARRVYDRLASATPWVTYDMPPA